MFCITCWKTTETINVFEKDIEKGDVIVKYMYGICKECNNVKREKIGWTEKKYSVDLLC